jgi:hypothetical protein
MSNTKDDLLKLKKVTTGVVRGSYVHVFKKKLNNQSKEEEYSMQILIPKEDKVTLRKIARAIEAAKELKWGSKPPRKLTSTLKDGDNDEHIPESAEPGEAPYAGHYFMNLKNDTKPQVVDKYGREITSDDFVSGDYCKVSMNGHAFDGDKNKGTTFYLGNVMLVEKGEPLGGGGATKAEDDFDFEDAEDALDGLSEVDDADDDISQYL